jgi:hypothetical protein
VPPVKALSNVVLAAHCLALKRNVTSFTAPSLHDDPRLIFAIGLPDAQLAAVQSALFSGTSTPVAETCLVESYNSVLRRRLARLHRKTKCYSKSAEMLRLSVLLLINKNLALYL